MMYVDLVVLFLIYSFSVIALGVSLYALWTLKEIEQHLKNQYNRKLKNAWDHYHNKSTEQAKNKKSIWG